jgi:hypothetical protein
MQLFDFIAHRIDVRLPHILRIEARRLANARVEVLALERDALPEDDEG